MLVTVYITKRILKNKSGLSLLELIFAMSLSVLVVAIVSQLSLSTIKNTMRISKQLDKESLRNVIRLRMDCKETTKVISGTGRNAVFLSKEGEEIFPKINSAGRILMVFQDFHLWLNSFDATTGVFELLVFDHTKETINEAKELFKIPLACELNLNDP